MFADQEILVPDRKSSVIRCSPETSIREAAKTMTENAVGSILIVDNKDHPKGIITDSDLRKKVVATVQDTDKPVSCIMTSPVVTVSGNLTAAEIIIKMMRDKIRHLCITEDGTSESPIRGIISEHDLLVMRGDNPAVLVKEIHQAREAEVLKSLSDRTEGLLRKYLEQGASTRFIMAIATEINDALIERSIELALANLKKNGEEPPVTFCWLSMGSEGRGEQILRTDQDNAIVYEDNAEPERTHQFFVKLGQETNRLLNVAGFEYCPANMMAGNPRWCMSVSEWKQTFGKWIRIPESENLMHTSIFFDLRAGYGNVALKDELTEFILSEKNQERLFIPALSENAMQHPGRKNFFGKLILEKKGEGQGRFDIKRRCMMPIIDAARLMAIDLNFFEDSSTMHRLEFIGKEKGIEELCLDLRASLCEFIAIRALSGLKEGSSGRYIDVLPDAMLKRRILTASQAVERIRTYLKLNYRANT